MKAEINDLKSEIENIKTMIVANQSIANSQQPAMISSASISQNIPNPFTKYNYNQLFNSTAIFISKIVITDKNGTH